MNRELEKLPHEGLAAVMQAARKSADSENARAQVEDHSEAKDMPYRPEDSPRDRFQPASADQLAWLGQARQSALAGVSDKNMVTGLIDWFLRISGPPRAKAVFHTEVGKISIPVLQHTKANDDSVLVLLLDPKHIPFYPTQGMELLFSLEHEGGETKPAKMTILSGPWSLAGFPVAFLLLWDQNRGMQDNDEQELVKDAVIASSRLADIDLDGLEKEAAASIPFQCDLEQEEES